MLGTVDRRKAVIELIRGFQSANVPNDTVLAIAGAIQNHSEADIVAVARPLLASGRMIFRPSFLSPEELDLWYAAVDATAPLYFDTPSLSANLLRSLAFHRPVLVNRFGYSGMVVDRFSVGVSCSVRDLSSVAAAVEAIWKFRSPHFEPDVSRLLAFHDPQNFCRAIWEATGVLPTGTSLANVYEDEGPATGGLSHFP
jgi:hypothetical protein